MGRKYPWQLFQKRQKMIIKNVLVYTAEKKFEAGAVRIAGDRIVEICFQALGMKEEAGLCLSGKSNEEVLDGQGDFLIPGMIDIHTHGCVGYDFCDGTLEAVQEMARYQASIGVTTFVPATMTLPLERLEQILQIGARFHKERKKGKYPLCAELAGINMEGPFISRTAKGAQNEAYIIPARAEIFEQFQQAAEGLIKYIGIAPEEYEALGFVEQVKEQVKVTVAHSNADYATAKKAFEAGASHVTHLYNGMSAYHHREPGIVGAVADCKQVEAELIGDGWHVHPAVIRSTFAMLGAERIILISDSIRATGMPNGVYELGGQKVLVTGNRAVLEDGTIAGSVTALPDNLRYIVKEVGIPLEEAVACVTQNPAKSLGLETDRGVLAIGKRADMVFLDKELVVRNVIKDGVLL